MKTTADFDLVHEVGKDFCLRHRCYPTHGDQNTLFFVAEKHHELLIEALAFKSQKEVILTEVPVNILDEQLVRLSINQTKKSNYTLANLNEDDLKPRDEGSVEELRKKSQSEPIVKLVNEIVDQGISEGATDIHIEPKEDVLKIRFRKDGLLRSSITLPKWVQAPLVSRIKILAELDIAEKRLPQDGRIKWMLRGESIDMRISTLPTRLGEKVVMRVLKHSIYISTLDSLGMPDDIFKHLKSIVHKPQGMFFVTGPTGSGKTSTLYAALREILHKDINICTIEDPIEYRLDGANQVQVNEKAGLTFAGALRSLLRQDPDVIFVGEIRDEETAHIAVQAAQTGHLVLSTLHTNDSASAVTRLLDLKIKPFLISSAVLGVLAQRLVRRVCQECIEWKPPTEEFKLLIRDLPDLVPVPLGCKHCQNTGYSGRVGLFELLVITPALREAISTGQNEQRLREIGALMPLYRNGLNKIKQGLTTPEELLRVAQIEE